MGAQGVTPWGDGGTGEQSTEHPTPGGLLLSSAAITGGLVASGSASGLPPSCRHTPAPRELRAPTSDLNGSKFVTNEGFERGSPFVGMAPTRNSGPRRARTVLERRSPPGTAHGTRTVPEIAQAVRQSSRGADMGHNKWENSIMGVTKKKHRGG